MAKKMDYRKLTLEAIDEVGAGVQEGTPEFEAAVAYLTDHWEIAQDKQAAKDVDLSVKAYALTSIGNGILDGNHEAYIEDTKSPKGQEIIEVDQNEVKKALKTLVTRENDFLGFLYDMHTEYNQKYFFGQLSHPFITIDKMSNKTLGNYTHGEDAIGITNHIRFNRNFIALNQGENGDDPTRILETLRHEMIHQWQDEVLYMKQGVAARQVKLPVGFGKFLDKSTPAKLKYDKSGAPIGEMTAQKSRPKEWHNRDFKEYAVVVDIPARGDKCYGNPANMPEGQSYNRKFTCKCIASNDAPLTIWSTREVRAICTVCKSPFIEQKKAGGTVQVVLSNIEAPGEDGMETKMKAKGYEHFAKFPNKKERDAFVEKLYEGKEEAGLEVEQGFYLKGNNAHKEGFTHWVAYNGDLPKVNKKVPAKPNAKAPEPEAPKAPKAKKPAARKAKVKPAPEVEIPAAPVTEPEPELPKVEVPVTEPELPKEKPSKKKGKVIPLPTSAPEVPKATELSHTNPKHLLQVYKETGSIKGVAEYFGMTSPNIIYHAKKAGVDFKKGVIIDGDK